MIIPPARTKGQLIWIPSGEFERCFEAYEPESIWELGCVVNFDDAAAASCWLNGFDDDDDDDAKLYMITIDSDRDTFVPDDWWPNDSDRWPELMDLALQLRKELAADPEQVVRVLERDDLEQLAVMVGLTRTPMHMEVAAAIAVDSASGLGGAALDHAVWCQPGLFGHNGAQLSALLEIVQNEDYVRLNPMENLLLYTGSLHPGTTETTTPRGKYYQMSGCYVVSKISYHSDPHGTVVGGWRQVYLERIASPKR